MQKLNKVGTWAKDSNGKWHYTPAKTKTTIRLGSILDNGPEDEISDPELLRESGGHVDPESGEWIEDDY